MSICFTGIKSAIKKPIFNAKKRQIFYIVRIKLLFLNEWSASILTFYIFHFSALKDTGYESDSTLVFKRRENMNQLSPTEQKMAYKVIQRGGDVPLHGLRKPAPERPKG